MHTDKEPAGRYCRGRAEGHAFARYRASKSPSFSKSTSACAAISWTSIVCASLTLLARKQRVLRPPATKFKRKTPPFRRGFFV